MRSNVSSWWNVIRVWILLNKNAHSGFVSISNAAFSHRGFLPELWFANQMNQVCLWFWTILCNSKRRFCICRLPSLRAPIGCCQAAATAHCRNTKAKQIQTKTNKQAAEQGHHEKHCLPHWVCIHVISFLKIRIMGSTGSPKHTEMHTNTPRRAIDSRLYEVLAKLYSLCKVSRHMGLLHADVSFCGAVMAQPDLLLNCYNFCLAPPRKAAPVVLFCCDQYMWQFKST